MENFKSGFVNIIGRPNVGKSTLMNQLIEEKLSIITKKAQTTRHRILGIINSENWQIIFSDTPGIIKPNYELQNAMMNFVKDVYSDADILILMLEPNSQISDIELFEKQFKGSKAKKILLLNKIDKLEDTEVLTQLDFWKNTLECDCYLPISALNKVNLDVLFGKIVEFLPIHPPYYEKDAFTDKPTRFFMSEIIREKILLNYKNEIPYSVEVVVEEFQEEEKIIRILANIISNKKSHKPILIGKGGSKLKKVGTEARKDMESFLGKKVYLELYVKINENWRDNSLMLKRLGYN